MEGCPTYLLGFDTQSKLDRHIKLYHHKTDSKLEFPEPDPQKPLTLRQVIKRGDLTEFVSYLSSGADINILRAKTPQRGAPLNAAADDGHFEICEWLLQNGADINTTGFKGRTPLHSAVLKGHIEIVRFLLSQEECLVNEVDNNGMSPFLIACEMGNLAIVKLLAETGKVQTDRHPYGLPPLGYASKNGHLPTVLYLLREMQRGPVTREILAATILNGHKSVAEALLPAIASSSQDSSLDRPYDSGFPPDRVKLGPDRFVIFNQHISRLLDVDFIPMPGISGVKSITFSHCGRYIALARPHGIEIYDIIKMERTANSKHDGIRGHKDIMSFSPDGKYLVAVTAAQFSSVSVSYHIPYS